jgi:hypothetical protein
MIFIANGKSDFYNRSANHAGAGEGGMPHATPNRGAGSDGGFSPRPRFALEFNRPVSTR